MQSLGGLIHCAGIIHDELTVTSEGIETNFAVNYLSRYLLTRKLLPVLEKDPDPRAVIIAAAGHFSPNAAAAGSPSPSFSRGW